MDTAQRVAIVVGAGFAAELERLAARQHVWALRSPDYEHVAQQAWAAARAHRPGSGVTLFRGRGLGPEEELIAIIGTVEEYYGVYGHALPLREIEVLGAEPTAAVRAQLRSRGFAHVSPSRHGFVATRPG